jgi:RNA polymerase sigma-70 factor (ECF subfamily)
MHESSSQRLLHQLRAGQEDAAARVFAAYAERLLGVARGRMGGRLVRRVDPDDIVQSAFRILFLRLRQGAYKPGGAHDLWKLLVVIVLNKVRRQARFHRAARRNVSQEQSARPGEGAAGWGPEFSSVEPGPEEFALLKDEFASWLERLAPRDRPILELRLQGYGTEEIARQTGRAERTVRRVLEQIRRRLSEAADDGRQPSRETTH